MSMATKTAGDIAASNYGLVAAMTKSGQVWVNECQTFAFSMASIATAQFDRNVTFCRAVSKVTAPLEVIALQRNYSWATAETAVQATGQLTQASARLFEQTMAPLTARLTAAMERSAEHRQAPRSADIIPISDISAGDKTNFA